MRNALLSMTLLLKAVFVASPSLAAPLDWDMDQRSVDGVISYSNVVFGPEAYGVAAAICLSKPGWRLPAPDDVQISKERRVEIGLKNVDLVWVETELSRDSNANVAFAVDLDFGSQKVVDKTEKLSFVCVSGPKDQKPSPQRPTDLDLEALCGDGLQQEAEFCDWGPYNGTGCSATCDRLLPDSNVLISTCGNGLVDLGEVCDWGPHNAKESIGCRADCIAK